MGLSGILGEMLWGDVALLVDELGGFTLIGLSDGILVWTIVVRSSR